MSLNDFIEKEKKRLAPVRAIFGPIKRKSIPILEDCVNYPKEPLRELFFLGRQIESEGMVADTEEKTKKYDEIVERIKPLENPKPRIYLWEEGKMPQETEYLEYDRYDYNHAPISNRISLKC